jgi:glutamyl-tRNA synthetase
VYAHLPTVLNEQGEKMSKRHGARPVTQYRDEGYLPDAVVNYLARLGWSHGDDEIFSREQLIAWFNLDHLGRSAGQFDEAKLRWVNAQHMKAMADDALASLVAAQLASRGLVIAADARLAASCGLFKDRCSTTIELADWAQMLFAPVSPSQADLDQHVGEAVRPALHAVREAFTTVAWEKAAIAAEIKAALAAHGLKMPQLATALRVLVCGRAQTPSIDAVLALFERQTVLERLAKA